MDIGYDVEVKVISQEGECSKVHKVGDSWIIGDKTREGICIHAFVGILPELRVLRYGGEFSWVEDKDTAIVACPDGKNPVIFQLRRLR